MQNDYISREALIEELKRRDFYPVIVKRAIEAIPAADVRPVAHGAWVPGDYYDLGDVCSFCDFSSRINDCDWSYCPNCGAVMDCGSVSSQN